MTNAKAWIKPRTARTPTTAKSDPIQGGSSPALDMANGPCLLGMGRFFMAQRGSEIPARDQVVLMRLARKILAEIGMRDRNQQLRPFRHRAAL